MRSTAIKPAYLAMAAAIAMPLSSGVTAQEQGTAAAAQDINVIGTVPADLSGMPEGPEIEGIISSRGPASMKVSSAAGVSDSISISPSTEVKATGGFLGLNRKELSASSLLNGLPVTVRTVQWNDGLIASQIRFKSSDLETAEMIHGGTAQRFAEHDEAIGANTAATEALRSRMADIDKYNIKGTTNVYFDTGKWNLTPAAERELCGAASDADAMDNALLLVVGYTDSTGSQEFNQVLSERRAGRVVNHLQQQCGWKPWRMLTPTGMAEADPLADNSTPQGKAQNRRVAVNILVSKSVDEQ